MGIRTERRTVYPPVARGSFSTPLNTRSTARPRRVRGRASGGTGSWLTLTDVVLLGCAAHWSHPGWPDPRTSTVRPVAMSTDGVLGRGPMAQDARTPHDDVGPSGKASAVHATDVQPGHDRSGDPRPTARARGPPPPHRAPLSGQARGRRRG